MNKKVCILTSVHPVFDTRIFHKEAKTLHQAGYDVTLIAQYRRNEVVEGVKIKAVPKPRNRVERMLFTIWHVFKKALKEKAHIYHFHDPELLLVAILLKLLNRAKLVYDVHEHHINAIRSKTWIVAPLRPIAAAMLNLIEYLLVPRLGAVIYTTPIVGGRYLKKAKKAVRVENYPLSQVFNKPSLPKKSVAIYSGGISPQRGIEIIIKAFSALKANCTNSLILMGSFSSNEYRARIESLIKKEGLPEKIAIQEPVSYLDLETKLSNVLIGLIIYQPTPNNMSCLPNKLFEYMGAGLAIVASDFPLYREIVESARCGLLVDPTSWEEVAKALDYLFKNPQQAIEMGNSGKKAILEKYNWENEAKKLLEVYAKIT